MWGRSSLLMSLLLGSFIPKQKVESSANLKQFQNRNASNNSPRNQTLITMLFFHKRLYI